jgi:hypothetical protein
MKIKRRAIIELYDVHQKENTKHISSVTGMLGEPLAEALLAHKFEKDGWTVKTVGGTPTNGKRNSPRLDFWMAAEKKRSKRIYQVEVKNWSVYSYSTGKKSLAFEANELYADFSKAKWNTLFAANELRKELKKVTIRMSVPKDYAKWEHLALACFWFPLHPSGETQSRFKMDVKNEDVKSEDFKKLTIFSMSAYLRHEVSSQTLNLKLPRFEKRMSLVKSLFQD